MTKEKNVILTARDIVVEFDVRDKVLTAIRGVSLELVEGEDRNTCKDEDKTNDHRVIRCFYRVNQHLL